MISLVIPVYNRQDTVTLSLQRIRAVLSSITQNYEIIVVNDGSTDRTLEVLQVEQSSDRQLEIITYPDNRGNGYAVRKGVMESQGDIVVFTDRNLDISPSVITEYIHQLETCDLVIGSKSHPLSKVYMTRSWRFLSKAFNLLVRIATGIKVSDTESGPKAGEGRSLRELFKLMGVKRYAFDVELLALASLFSLRVVEMPVEMTLDRRFKIKDIVWMFVDLMAIAYRCRIRGYYERKVEKDWEKESRLTE